MDHQRIVADASFPRVSLPSYSGGRPVEVMLIAQLDPGAGDSLIAQTGERQRHHPAHHDALDEPSAQLSAPDFGHDDRASLFSFSVGPQGHPFHCHAGNRVFTAITGSGGAQLRFSTASAQQLRQDPRAFLQALRYVDLPGDSLFTVRFGGGTWHQFVPAQGNAAHSAFFALSCHPDEAGGDLSPEQQALVTQGTATIASLTELLPPPVAALLQSDAFRAADVPTVSLSLHVKPQSWQQRACSRARRWSGRIRQLPPRTRRPGFVATRVAPLQIRSLHALPADALLREQLSGQVHFQDAHQLRLDTRQLRSDSLQGLMCDLLQAFVDQPPGGVSGLMRLRNLMVKPLGLRTSHLGCPVSSLLDPSAAQRFCRALPGAGTTQRRRWAARADRAGRRRQTSAFPLVGGVAPGRHARDRADHGHPGELPQRVWPCLHGLYPSCASPLRHAHDAARRSRPRDAVRPRYQPGMAGTARVM